VTGKALLGGHHELAPRDRLNGDLTGTAPGPHPRGHGLGDQPGPRLPSQDGTGSNDLLVGSTLLPCSLLRTPAFHCLLPSG
jgi:hypothetical protein